MNQRSRMKSIPKHIFVWIGKHSASIDIVGGIRAIREAECAWLVDQLRKKRVDIDQLYIDSKCHCENRYLRLQSRINRGNKILCGEHLGSAARDQIWSQRNV